MSDLFGPPDPVRKELPAEAVDAVWEAFVSAGYQRFAPGDRGVRIYARELTQDTQQLVLALAYRAGREDGFTAGVEAGRHRAAQAIAKTVPVPPDTDAAELREACHRAATEGAWE